jgi:hypothetical protein
MTWFEKFAALWTLVDLSCRGCGRGREVVLRPLALGALLAALGMVPFMLVLGGFPEMPAWLKALLMPLAAVLAFPFLLLGAATAAVALCVKPLASLPWFAGPCPECRRRWKVTGLGVARFRSSFR